MITLPSIIPLGFFFGLAHPPHPDPATHPPPPPHPHTPSHAHTHSHVHGNFIHSHVHGQDPEQHGHAPEATPVGWMDRVFGQLGLYQALRPLAVGLVHGLAGSAAGALLGLTPIPDAP